MGSLKGLSTRAVVLVLGLALLLVALILGLVHEAGPEGRAEVLTWISSIGALIAGSLGASATVYGVRNARQGKETATAVAQVAHQTNGALDARIEKAIVNALERSSASREASSNAVKP